MIRAARRYLGNTGYIIPGGDYYLLGILSSSATWFLISKTAQPLSMHGDRWQYRLFGQFMKQLPIPEAADADREAIAELARRCNALGQRRYDLQENVRRQLTGSFAESSRGEASTLNLKAKAWWTLSLSQLGEAAESSFKLKASQFKNSRPADEWEPYLEEKRREVEHMSRELADAEAELNQRVYALFHLTPEEVALLQREAEH